MGYGAWQPFASSESGWIWARWFAALVLALWGCGCGSGLTPLPVERTVKSVLEWTHENGVPGSILLIETPKARVTGTIGRADVKRKILMRSDCAFRIGSITKTFVGIVAAQLAADGKLDVDLPITAYLPRSVTDHIRNSARITVRHLATHRSGIYDFLDNKWALIAYFLDSRGEWPPSRFLKYAYDKPAQFPPGGGYRYCNTNFLLLGMIIDRVVGHSYTVETRNRILTPLALADSYSELDEAPRPGRAHGYERWLGFTMDVSGWTPAAGGYGGMVSTASDLAVFIRAAVRGDGFVTGRARDLVAVQPTTASSESNGREALIYNFGMAAERSAGPEVSLSAAPWFFGHSGATPGYFSLAYHEPVHDVTVVYFGSTTLRDPFHPRRYSTFLKRLHQSLFPLALDVARNDALARFEGN